MFGIGPVREFLVNKPLKIYFDDFFVDPKKTSPPYVPDLCIEAGQEKKMGPLEVTATRRGACFMYVDVDSKSVENMKCDAQFFVQ